MAYLSSWLCPNVPALCNRLYDTLAGSPNPEPSGVPARLTPCMMGIDTVQKGGHVDLSNISRPPLPRTASRLFVPAPLRLRAERRSERRADGDRLLDRLVRARARIAAAAYRRVQPRPPSNPRSPADTVQFHGQLPEGAYRLGRRRNPGRDVDRLGERAAGLCLARRAAAARRLPESLRAGRGPGVHTGRGPDAARGWACLCAGGDDQRQLHRL